MSVRAKFECVSKIPSESDPTIVQVRFEARYGTDGSDNAAWSKWTPSGVLDMQITNVPAHEQFTVGKKYFLDITEAE